MTLVQTLTGNNNKVFVANGKVTNVVNATAPAAIRDTQIKDLMLIKLLSRR